MRTWETIYRANGVLHQDPALCAVKAAELFSQHNVSTILDFGCGTGRHCRFFKDKGFLVQGCDISQSAIDIASKNNTDMKFAVCEMTEVDYDNEQFSAVFCHQVIQHALLVDVRKAIFEIFRVLKKGGILALTTISTEHPNFKTGSFIEDGTKINISSIDADTPHHFFDEKEMRNEFSHFEILKLEHLTRPSEFETGKTAALWRLWARRPE